jgi:dTDP-4-amino-4,6-dideoxygalactose transaminase/glycosyltransferase involved in cell wall biosynthesis
MKIGYIASSLSSGDGWSRYAQGLSGAVIKLPDITIKTITSVDSDVEADNIFKVLPSHLTFRAVDQLKVFYQCLKHFNDCDIIHILYEKPMIGAAFASRIIGAHYIMTLHGTYSIPPIGYSPKAIIKRWLMGKAHDISRITTTGSFNTEARLRAILPNVKESRFIPNGFDDKIFKPRPDISNEGFLLGVGGIKDRKGFDIVIKALGTLKNEFPELKYKIIGFDDDKETDSYYQYLVQLANDNGLNGRIEMRVGKISRVDLAKEYNKCNAFILTPRDSASGFEGFPLVYMEAQACGAPVIATKGFGSEYAVRDDTGILVESENVEQTAKAIRTIFGNYKLRDEMSHNAVKHANNHSWNKIAHDHLLRFYQDAMIKVPFLRLDVADSDVDSMVRVLKSGWLVLANEGRKFEYEFSRYLGVKEAVLTNSCTSSIHLSLIMAGVGPGDEVITTPLTYVSTVNPILYCGAKPVFVDVEPETGLIDVSKIEKAITGKTKAILPVHLYGQMADMKVINEISKKHNLIVIEDAAHAIEAERDGIRPGQTSFSACFSFHVAKNITAGEGGALVVNNKKRADMTKLLRRDGVKNFGVKRRMSELGYKYLMTDFQAALLSSQLERIEERSDVRKKLFHNYYEAFHGISDLSFPKIVPNSRHAYHMFVVWVPSEHRDDIQRRLSFKGIETSVHYEPVHLEPYYRNTFGFKEGDFPIAEKIGASTITMPLHLKMTPEDQRYVIKHAIKILRRIV